MSGKVWFITGASRGFGRIWAEAALNRGDGTLALDVTDADQVRGVVERTHGHFGRLDVILNNAGYALVGAVEETAAADIKAEFETNIFGTLRVIQAALPLLAQRGADDFLDLFRQSLAPVAGGAVQRCCDWSLRAIASVEIVALRGREMQFGRRVCNGGLSWLAAV